MKKEFEKERVVIKIVKSGKMSQKGRKIFRNRNEKDRKERRKEEKWEELFKSRK